MKFFLVVTEFYGMKSVFHVCWILLFILFYCFILWVRISIQVNWMPCIYGTCPLWHMRRTWLQWTLNYVFDISDCTWVLFIFRMTPSIWFDKWLIGRTSDNQQEYNQPYWRRMVYVRPFNTVCVGIYAGARLAFSSLTWLSITGHIKNTDTVYLINCIRIRHLCASLILHIAHTCEICIRFRESELV